MKQYAASEADLAKLDTIFTYHSPLPDQPERYTRIRSEAREFGLTLMSNCPPSRELSLAITHLEEAVFYANAAIARNEQP